MINRKTNKNEFVVYIDHWDLIKDYSSEIDFFQLHLLSLRCKNWIVKHLHDVFRNSVRVNSKFFISHGLILRVVALNGGASLEPGQKLLIFLKCFKGIKDVCFFTKEAVNGGSFIGVAVESWHAIQAIILLIINQHDAKPDK